MHNDGCQLWPFFRSVYFIQNFQKVVYFRYRTSRKNGIYTQKYSISHTKPRRNYWMNSNGIEFRRPLALYIQECAPLVRSCECIIYIHSCNIKLKNIFLFLETILLVKIFILSIVGEFKIHLFISGHYSTLEWSIS